MDWLFSIIFSYEAIPVFSLIVALVAVWFTIRESRSNNNVIIKMLECSVSPQKDHCVFSLSLKNKGITLHDIQIFFAYSVSSNNGELEIKIPVNNYLLCSPCYTGIFSKGMIAKFGLKSNELKGFLPFVKIPSNVRFRNAKFYLYSQGYIAKTIKIGGLKDGIISRWNKFSNKVFFGLCNNFFSKTSLQKTNGINSRGIKFLRRYILPTFPSIEGQLKHFIELTGKESQIASTDNLEKGN